MDYATIDKLTILGLSVMLGCAFPLMITNSVDAFTKKSVLHGANAIHSILFLALSFITVFFRAIPPPDCLTFRTIQAILFHFYVFMYEFTLAFKAKAILGRYKIKGVRLIDVLFVISMLGRISISLGTTITMDVIITDKNTGSCMNKYNPIWFDASNYARNILELVWSLLFLIPIIKVLSSTSTSVNSGFYSKINSTPYAQIFIANCFYPLIANCISLFISLWLSFNKDKYTMLWITLLLGIQNFVSSYSVNLILNLKVSTSDDNSSAADSTVLSPKLMYDDSSINERRFPENSYYPNGSREYGTPIIPVRSISNISPAPPYNARDPRFRLNNDAHSQASSASRYGSPTPISRYSSQPPTQYIHNPHRPLHHQPHQPQRIYQQPQHNNYQKHSNRLPTHNEESDDDVSSTSTSNEVQIFENEDFKGTPELTARSPRFSDLHNEKRHSFHLEPRSTERSISSPFQSSSQV